MKQFLLIVMLTASTLYAQIQLPRLISNGMVLQRESEISIYGRGNPGDTVTINFLNSLHVVTVSSDGQWTVPLKNLPAGGPHTMTITTKDTLIELTDIFIGDVWVCSGQSNMELPIRRVKPLYTEEIQTANNPYIRHFRVPYRYNFREPQNDLYAGKWEATTPQTILDFTAVGYFFAKELYEIYKVPIGLINASLGGSPVEAWISENTLKQFPAHYQEALRFRDSSLIQAIITSDNERMKKWYDELYHKDEGYKSTVPWYSPTLNDKRWDTMNIPGYWNKTKLGKINGVVWFRKQIILPESLAGKPAFLNLGRIVDADSVYINGIFVGSTGYQYPPRWYNVPAGILKVGRNVLTVRIINTAGAGGFVPDKPYELVIDSFAVPLTGTWKYRLGATMPPLAGQTFIQWKPLGLYNGMIAPLLRYRIKGVIWYQGESNAERPCEYRNLFSAMIEDWRKNWNQGSFPFLFVQLANFMEAPVQPKPSNWAMLREAQTRTLSVPNTAMAVTIDVGEWNDIHPLRKKEVGQRLAHAARVLAYGEDRCYSGPQYQSMQIHDNKIYITFKNTCGGLVAKGEPLKHFAIAGTDKHFVWANARITGDTVIVWNDTIQQPVAVRYAWADNPEGANLYNKEGYPAIPFRTDNWDDECP